MKGRSLILLTIALGCGLTAMLGVRELVQSSNEGGTEMVQVLVALTDIGSGVPLDESNTSFKEFPSNSVPSGVVTNRDEVEERSLRTAAVAGEMIMIAKLGEKGDLRASAEIPDGFRLVTVPVDATTTHAGQMAPNDRVDVMLTYDARDSRSREVRMRSRVVLQNIQIFSVDNVRERDGAAEQVIAKNVSLLVTLEQAQLMILAMNKGKLHYVLKSKSDMSEMTAEAIDDSVFEEWSDADLAELNAIGKSEDRVLTETEAIRQALENNQIGRATGDGGTEENGGFQQIPAAPTPGLVMTGTDSRPKTAVWEITIFSGNEKKTEAFEIPADQLSPPTLDLNRLTAPKGDWRQWLEKIL